MKQAVFFDLDGTLLDTIGDLTSAVNDALEEVGVPYRYTKEECMGFIGNGSDLFLHRALKDYDEEKIFIAAKKAYMPRYRSYQGRTTVPFPGMRETLLKLKEGGILLFVCTNKPDALANIIIREKLGDDLFTEIRGHVEGEPVKPDPHIILSLMERYDLSPENCRMVGDSLPDLEIGENAKMKTVLCAWGYGHYERDHLYERADRVIRRVEEIEGIFDRRLFVFDVDQTIVVRGEKEIRPTEIMAIRSLLSKGEAVALASGRPFKSLKHFIDQFGDGERYIIAANGAAFYDSEGNITTASTLRLKDLYHFHDQFMSDKVYIYAYDEHSSIVIYRESFWSNLEVELCLVDPKTFTFLDENEMPKDHDVPLLKIMIASDPETSSKIVLSPEERASYSITRSDPCFLEILSKGLDKGQAVENLRLHMGIPHSNVYCFGDNDNDIAMVERFYGIAVDNATENCKAVAKEITKSVKENGVSYSLKEILHAI